MSSLREPDLGPIVGHTTETSCRIWIRGAAPGDKGATLAANNRTLGVISITHKNDKKIPSPKVYYFRLKREYDRTGTFTFGVDTGIGDRPDEASPPLEPDTFYMVKVGTLTLDDPVPDDATKSDEEIDNYLPKSIAWRNELTGLNGPTCYATFRTYPTADTSPNLNFILGSCRYPGMLWKTKKADVIFGPLKKVALDGYNPFSPDDEPQEADQCRFTLMVGDQIYADKLSINIPVGLANTAEEFQERYLTAFGSINMQQLLSNIPTYMILDDHEIEDNWTQDRIRKKNKRSLFNMALNSYMSYQWNHSPKTFGKRLYYKFDCSGYPFFVLDTRTQRFIDNIEKEDSDNHMLGTPALSMEDEPGQIDRFIEWLEEQQNTVGDAPKFVVTSSVFTPNPMSARTTKSVKQREDCDSWPGFPNTRRLILDCIAKHKVQNVIFLSGDIHCANIAKMRFNGNADVEKLKSFSITSSAFYWPFPFADGDPSNYVHDSAIDKQKDTFQFGEELKLTMDYTAEGFTQDDNFCHVAINRDKNQIMVTAFNKEGEIINRKGGDGVTRSLITTLDLAPW